MACVIAFGLCEACSHCAATRTRFGRIHMTNRYDLFCAVPRGQAQYVRPN
jgi:coenzyme F420-reducing hydrogenase beta subunit